MKQFATFIIFFALLSHSGFSQNNADSLQGVWLSTSNSDTIRLAAVNAFVRTIIRAYPDSAIYYLKPALELAESIGDLRLQAEALHYLGFAISQKSDFDSAIEYYNRSLSIKKQIGDKSGMAKSLNNIGIAQDRLGNYDKSVEFYSRSIKLKEEIGDEKGIATTIASLGTIYSNRGDESTAIDLWRRSINIFEKIGDVNNKAYPLNNIAGVYFSQENYPLALEYYKRALDLFKSFDHKQELASCLNNIGNVYFELGDHDTALSHYSEAMTIHKQIGNKRGIARSLNIIGLYHLNRKDYDMALDNFTRAFDLNAEIGDKKRITSSLIYLGKVHLELGDVASAKNAALAEKHYSASIKYNLRGISIAKKVGVPVDVMTAAESLYRGYKVTGNLDSALKMHELYLTLRDSIESIKNQREIIEQEYKYAYEKQAFSDSLAFAKQQEIATLEISERKAQIRSSRNLIFALVSLVVLGTFAIILGYKNYRRKAHQEKILDMLVKTQTEELRNALDKLKEHQFNLAHKIRVPIAELLGMLDVVRENPQSPEAEKIKLDVIDDSAKKIDDIIHEITDTLHDK